MATTTIQPAIVPPPTSRRVWPVPLLIALGAGLYFSPNLIAVAPESMPVMLLFMSFFWGPALCALLLLGWWLVRGPAPLRTRWLAAGVGILLSAAAVFAADPSIRLFLGVHGIPAAMGAAALCLFVPPRRPSLRTASALLLGFALLVPWDLGRFNGMTGTFGMDFSWRWTATGENEALAYAEKAAGAGTAAKGKVPAVASATDWPGFRGAKRDGIAPMDVGDWAANPPREMWRHPVGPAWSSFCVVGDRAFTQEQLGNEEMVTCYAVADGRLIWKWGEKNRHSDFQSGAGPRATPTFHDRKVYALGAKGMLVCLDAADGKLQWKADLKKIVGDTMPMWGMSASPLVVGGKVIVTPGLKGQPRLLAFDAKSGDKLWAQGEGSDGYSSPQLAQIDKVPQVLIFTSGGLAAHDPATGKELWQYSWDMDGASPAVTQPRLLGNGKIVLGGGRVGIDSRCLQVALSKDGWKVDEVWTTKFSPGFNDFVHHAGHLFGLQGGRLWCVDAATGKIKWRGGQYGGGQVLLVGDKVLVQAEDGTLVLAKASPEGHEVVASLAALKEKTWNHPVVANGKLFVRNAREAICFDLGGQRVGEIRTVRVTQWQEGNP